MKPRARENPPNRFHTLHTEYLDDAPGTPIEYLADASRQILAHNDSPDVGFSHSVNPYRGCAHACAYCYARPGHEYLGLGAGTDFETRIFVKPRAPELLREAFDKPSWKGELVAFSGVTDCYQPIESKLEITRRCLQVCAEYRNPVALITKAPLIERDIDVLQELHRAARVSVSLSIPFWKPEHARAMEPYVATPERRFQAMEALAKAGVPVGIGVAPVIPGLGDEDLVRLLERAKEGGATRAFYVMLRLPGAVKEVFEARLREKIPERAERVLHRQRETRGGKLYDSRFGQRQTGQGQYAEAVGALFEATVRRLGLRSATFSDAVDTEPPSPFRRPPGRQMSLF